MDTLKGEKGFSRGGTLKRLNRHIKHSFGDCDITTWVVVVVTTREPCDMLYNGNIYDTKES